MQHVALHAIFPLDGGKKHPFNLQTDPKCNIIISLVITSKYIKVFR